MEPSNESADGLSVRPSVRPSAALRRKISASAGKVAQVGLSKVLVWFERKLRTHSRVGTGPIIPAADFPWAAALERNWPQIRQELDELMTHYDALPNIQDIAVDQSELSQDDKWKTFFFFGFGTKVEGNCQRCPKTSALVEGIPDITTAFFSILGPGKHIQRHRGYYRGLVRYHLALKVPASEATCAIKVADQTVHWSEGSGFFFDDTYAHEAWNDTPGVRVVLLLDVIRPLSFPYSILNKAIIHAMARTPSVRNARVRQDAWERSFEKMLSRK